MSPESLRSFQQVKDSQSGIFVRDFGSFCQNSKVDLENSWKLKIQQLVRFFQVLFVAFVYPPMSRFRCWFTINRGTGSGTRCRATWRPVVCFHDGSPWFAPRSLRRTTAGWLRTYCVELFCWHTDGSFSYGLDLLRLDAEEMRLPESWISCGCSMTWLVDDFLIRVNQLIHLKWLHIFLALI